MQSVKFRSVISPLLFHARARGRRVGQLEAPAGKARKNAAGAAVVELIAQKVAARPGAPPLTLLQLFAQLTCRSQFCGLRTLLPSAIWGPHVGVSRSLAACDWRARLVFLAKHLMEHRCGVSDVPH